MNFDEIVEKSEDSKEMLKLVRDVKKIMKKEKKENGIFKLEGRKYAIIVGDLHGDLESLLFILKDSKFLMNEDYLVFLGDYGDRGEKSPEVYFLILSLKKEFPERVTLLRGNHEFPSSLPVSPHNLPDSLFKKYGKNGNKIYEEIRNLFEFFYNGAIIKKKYILLHGGLPVNLESIEDLEFAHKTHPLKPFLEEILWNDPSEEIRDFYPSPRGAGKIFGINVTKRILKKIGVKTLIRSHEACEGVKVNHEGMILTLFSRKGSPYFNSRAAYLRLNLKEKARDAYELSRIAIKF